jgi:ubiquinone/menaquinone biosynthesis C-methylase UbiE
MDGVCFNWVKRIVTDNGLTDLHTIELGAFDVNGSVAELFTDRLAVDERDGLGVEFVADGCALPIEWDDSFEVAISTETLEHVKRPWLFINEMARVVGAGGWVIVTTCDYGFGRHDFPGDYWRFSPEGLTILFTDAGLTMVEATGLEGSRLFFAGRKL